MDVAIFEAQKIDCHVHVLDPARFPYRADTHYAPMGQEIGTPAQLAQVMDAYGTRHALLVGPNSGYGLDNACMLDTIARDAGRYKGIAVVANDATLDELQALKRAGVVGVAWNVTHYGVDYYRDAEPLLKKLVALDMFVDIQVEHDQLVPMMPMLADKPIDASFQGVLRPEQAQTVDAVLAHRIGVLCAPTAFGKTVIAAALIAARKTNTLIIVHRTQLLDQWRNRLSAFLEIDDRSIGVIGAGKRSPTDTIDIGVMQSLVRKGVVRDVVAHYGQVIVDECHHVSAFSFERVMKEAKARFVLGLTATPVRRDGHHPIIFMQCGPIRFRGSNTRAMTQLRHVVIPRRTGFSTENAVNGIQSLFRVLGQSNDRNALIVRDIRSALDEGRNPLVLTERKDHLDQLADILQGTAAAEVIVLSGGMGRRRQAAAFGRLEEPSAKYRRIVLATGRFIGEGFDDPWLDTLFLAMPISWRGTLQQYAGRLHRERAGKHEVRIYDYVDADVPTLQRMFSKRLRGYRAMGYNACAEFSPQGKPDRS